MPGGCVLFLAQEGNVPHGSREGTDSGTYMVVAQFFRYRKKLNEAEKFDQLAECIIPLKAVEVIYIEMIAGLQE